MPSQVFLKACADLGEDVRHVRCRLSMQYMHTAAQSKLWVHKSYHLELKQQRSLTISVFFLTTTGVISLLFDAPPVYVGGTNYEKMHNKEEVMVVRREIARALHVLDVD